MSEATSERERALWLELTGLEPPDRSKPYRSCGYIEGGVVFWPNYISACCVMHSGGSAGIPYLADFSGGDLPLGEVMKTRKKMIETHQAGGNYAGCAGCPNLVEAEWGPKDYLIDNITLAHYTHCNLKCNYCYTVLKPEGNIKPKDVYRLDGTFESMIANGALSSRAVIRISGGEPAMLREFEELIDRIVDYGPHIIVFTNAVLYSEALARGLAKGQIEAVLGIDAASDDVYRLVKGTDDVEAAWENTARYAAINPEMAWAKMIVYQDNMNDVDAFVARCVAAKVRRVYCDIEAAALNHPETMPQVIEALGRLKYECDKRGILALYGEAGAQSHDGVLGEAQKRYRSLAEGDAIGRAMLFRGDLVDRIGIDGWTYEAAALVLGQQYREKIIDCWDRGFATTGDLSAIVAEMNATVEAAFRSAELPQVTSCLIALGYPNVLGSGWGPAESNNGRQRWRWIGPSGVSSLLLSLEPGRSYQLSLRVHTARDMDALAGLTVEVEGRPLSRADTVWQDGFCAISFDLPAAWLPETGRIAITVRVASDQPIRAVALESISVEKYAPPLGKNLLERIGVDGDLYEAATSVLGQQYRGKLVDCWDRGFATTGDLLAIVAEMNEIMEEAFRSAELPQVASCSIALGYPNVLGFGWGPAETNNGHQRWRWIGPSGVSSLLLSLEPGLGYRLCLRVHTARDMEVLECVEVEIDGVLLAYAGPAWNDGFYEMNFDLPAARLPSDGRAVMTLRLTTDQPIRAVALESVLATAVGPAQREAAALLEASPA